MSVDYPFGRVIYIKFKGVVHQALPQEWKGDAETGLTITRAYCPCGQWVRESPSMQVVDMAPTCMGCIVKEVRFL